MKRLLSYNDDSDCEYIKPYIIKFQNLAGSALMI